MYDLVKGRAKVLPILEVLGGLAAASVILIASYRVINGDLTPGSVIGFVTALLMLAQPARALGTFNAVAQEGLSALERIYSQIDIKPEIEGKVSNNKLALKLVSGPEIEFRKITFFMTEMKNFELNFFLKLINVKKLE